ncbi:YczE/YyaS/YitT family protein [Aureibacillus halotolerans]|uniref:Membrane protein YczE n=1 Tax=Aureibacillus halotolerans TaxID=1508390 RepID=A0A4V3D690_9BACI|nr:YitT family protein [Aureibacillus halotolerans]TDQ42997.1 hypothetical protein EV213_101429 [Aureibacillus halotolerans]
MKRFVIFIIGLLFLTCGIVLTIRSSLGTSPFDALLVGLSKTVGLTPGSWEVIIALLLIGLNAFLSKQRPEFLALVTALITGVFIDLWLLMLSPIEWPSAGLSTFILFGMGLIIMGFGTALYLHTNIAPIPIDRLMLLIKKITGMRLLYCKNLLSLVFLLLALFFHGPIGIGTILIVLLGGPLLSGFTPLAKQLDIKLSIKNQKTVPLD